MEVVVEGNAYVNKEIMKCCIGVEEGKIKSVKKILKGDKHYDFGEKLILPAGIDVHVHFRDPGMTHKEDFGTGSASAAYGGVTCALDMPNTIPKVTNIETLQDKARIAGTKAFIDFGLYAGVSQNCNFEGISKYATAFKLYLASTTGEMFIDDYEFLPNLFERIANTNKNVSVHCENETLINRTLKINSLREHLKSRPNECEASAIEKVIKSHNNARAHICHVSTAEGVILMENANLTSEVTPHHLFLNSNTKLGALGKVNPPLREQKDQDALWKALGEGKIDIIASDHAPHTPEEKERFEKAPSGMPGVETMLPLMLSLVKRGKFELGRLVNAVSERPGEIFEINKGKLEIGYDADMILVDMRKETKIKGENLHSKCGWTPFEGFSAVFPKFTFVRGEVVVEDWELTGESGFGRMIGNS